MTDHKFQPNKPAKEDLLNELQSIKGLLEESPPKNKLPEDLAIPTLDDVVEGATLNQVDEADTAEHATENEHTFAEDADLLDLDSIFEDPDTENQEQVAATDDAPDSSFDFELDDLEPSDLRIESSDVPVSELELKSEPDAQPPDSAPNAKDKLKPDSINDNNSRVATEQANQNDEPELSTAFNLDDLDTNVEIPNFKLSTGPGTDNEPSTDNQKDDSGDAPLDDEILIDVAMDFALEPDSDLATTTPDLDTLDSLNTLNTSNSDEMYNQQLQADCEDEQNERFPAAPERAPSADMTSHSADSSPSVSSKPIEAVDINLLIQEIVDEFIPVLEDELRQKLSHRSPEVIRQLAKKYLDK